jgi:hypothetical protein
MISVELLHKLLSYNPDTGYMKWKPMTPDVAEELGKSKSGMNIFNSKFANKELSDTKYKGYLKVSIRYQGEKKTCFQHRVAWALHNNEWPDDDMDHINGIRTDNRIENLRVVTLTENQRNQAISSRNTSGHMGVCWQKRTKSWRARISENNKSINLGHYKDKDEAIRVRKLAEIKYGYHPNHGRINQKENE